MKHLRFNRAIVAIAMMLIGWLPSLAHDFEVDGIYYTITSSIDDKTVAVSYKGGFANAYKNEYQGDIIIPEIVVYDGVEYSVTSITAKAFYECYGLKSVFIGNSVTSIGESTFDYCTSLTSVIIGDSVLTIGDSAFNHCHSLTSVEIGKSVTTIGNSAFYASGLTNITIGKSVIYIGESAFFNTNLTNVVWNAQKCPDFPNYDPDTSSYGPFWHLTSKITSFIFGKDVEYIPKRLLKDMDQLTNIVIPNSVITIGEGAFSNCTNISNLIIGNSVTSIGDFAFSECKSLTSIEIPNSVTSIGDYAFSGTNLIGELIIPDSVISIGDGAFGYCKELTSLVVGKSVSSIGYEVFTYCENLTAVTWNAEKCSDTTDLSLFGVYNNTINSFTFGESVKIIPSDLCRGITNLTNIAIPNHVTSIGDSAFANTSLTGELIIPDSVISIGDYAFGYCKELTSLVVGKSVSSIGHEVFTYCENLTAVTWNAENCLYANNFFSSEKNTPINSFIFGESVKTIPSYLCDGLTNLSNITFSNSTISIGDFAFSRCKSLTSIEIPNSVTSIGDNAFSSTNLIGELIIPDSVISIGNGAFKNCYNLAGVNISNSVISIGNSAFKDCYSLVSLSFGESVITIGDDAFSGCSKLGGKLILPNSLETIGNYAFAGCSKMNGRLILPNSLEAIGDYAFFDCSGFSGELILPNSLETIGNYAFSGCNIFGDTIVIPSSILSIGDCIFGEYSDFKSVEWNAKNCLDFESGNKSPFYNSNEKIKSFVFGDDVQYIPAYLCFGMHNIENIEITKNIVRISELAFDGCNNLTNIIWNSIACDNFEDKSKNPFYYNRSKIKSFELGNGVKNIPSYLCYDMIGLTSLKIPNSVNTIGISSFEGCEGLTSIEIPNSVTFIGDNIFQDCTNLAIVSIGESVTLIGNSAFNKCNSLISIDIPNSVTSIGDNAFQNCKNLTSVTIGKSVSSIGDNAFNDCSNLTGILTLPASLETIGDNAFCNTKYSVFYSLMDKPTVITNKNTLPVLEMLIVPLGSKEAYEAALYWNDAEYIIEEGSCDIEVHNTTAGNLMTTIASEARKTPASVTGMKVIGTINNSDIAAIKSNMTSLLRLDISETHCEVLPTKAFKDKLTLMEITLPNELKTIEAEAFSGCMALNDTIIIPKTVTAINNSSFYNCMSVPAIIFSEGLTSIGESAFQGCYSLTSIVIPNSVTAIGNNVFSGCSNIVSATLSDKLSSIAKNMFYNCYKLEEFRLPTAITTIGSSAFYGCSKLVLVDLSACDKLTSIENNAFENCSNIATINFPSSLTSIGASSFSNCRSLLEMSIPTATPPAIADDAKPFYHVDNLACVLSIPKESMIDYLSAQYWGAFVSIDEKEEIDVEIGTEEEIENGYHQGPGHKHHDGCHVHFHEGPQSPEPPNGPNDSPVMRRAQTIDEQVETAANAIAYSGSSLFVADDNCVTFEFTPQEGCSIIKVLYGGIDVTSQVVNNRFTTPIAEAGDVKKLQVIINKVYAESISLNITEVSLEVNETAEINVTILPKSATNKEVVWKSSDEAIATVDANGVVTAISVGEATITATTVDGSDLSASCKVTVVPTLARSITLDQTEINLEATQTTTLVATVLPELATDKSIAWSSSNEAIATVDANGLVTGIALGEATITATTDDGSNLSAVCKVTVVPTLVESITLDKSEISLEATETASLTATILPELATNKSVAWSSSNEMVAIVDANGVVTAIAVGEATITATTVDGSNLSTTCKITVVPTLAESITLSQTEINLEATETATLTATVLPDLATNKAVTWTSSDEFVATVDANGIVTAIALGEATITATTVDGSNLSASCKVTVVPTLVESITLDNTEISLEATETATLVATVLPETTSNKGVEWTSSDESVAIVSKKGVVTAIAVGEAVITATTIDGTDLSASCKVTVVPTLAESITLDKTEISLEATETATLIATVLPELATDKSVKWSSSNESVSVVDNNGVVTAISIGEAVITATTVDGSNLSASCKVTVIPTLAVSIELDQTEASVEEKSDLQLTAIILPEHTTNKEVAWSSSDKWVASVDNYGLVTMYSAGEVIITATTTDGTNLSATCCINVYSGIDGVNGDDVIVATVGDNIVVKNAKPGSVVNVYASNGALVASEEATDGSVVVEAPVKGVYVVKAGKQTAKVII